MPREGAGHRGGRRRRFLRGRGFSSRTPRRSIRRLASWLWESTADRDRQEAISRSFRLDLAILHAEPPSHRDHGTAEIHTGGNQ
jgi:hypothetical protein